MLDGGAGDVLFERVLLARDEQHPIEAGNVERLLRGGEVPEMRRIERAAEDPDGHRPLPSPKEGHAGVPCVGAGLAATGASIFNPKPAQSRRPPSRARAYWVLST